MRFYTYITAALLTFATSAHADVSIESGVFLGGGRVLEAPFLVAKPWFGFSSGEFAITFQAPLRFDLDTHSLRERDWDETSDYSRILYRAAFGRHLTVGELSNLTFGQGTIVRNYHNNLDDDHHRLGVQVAFDVDQFSIQTFADHVFNTPVVGFFGESQSELVTTSFTFAIDTGAPTNIQPLLSQNKTLVHDNSRYWAGGFEGVLHLFQNETRELRLYGAINMQSTEGFGGHIGIAFENPNVLARAEWMILGEDYDWAPFDFGYLLDRLQARLGSAQESTVGARGALRLNFNDGLYLEGEYADARVENRSDLRLALGIQTGNLDLQAFARQRFVARNELFSSKHALFAVNAEINLSDHCRISALLAQTKRVFKTKEQSDENSSASSFIGGLNAEPQMLIGAKQRDSVEFQFGAEFYF